MRPLTSGLRQQRNLVEKYPNQLITVALKKELKRLIGNLNSMSGVRLKPPFKEFFRIWRVHNKARC